MKKIFFYALLVLCFTTACNAQNGKRNSMKQKTLIAYFSATGTTKAAAQRLASEHDAIWWGICPRIINSWIDNNLEQLKSKTLVPFATSGSSGIEDAVAYLRKTYPELKWEKGKLMNN